MVNGPSEHYTMVFNTFVFMQASSCCCCVISQVE